MPEKPVISVIMPAYNTEQYIGKAIESILTQTFPHFELLIADDVSTDNTRKIIDSYKDNRIKCFHNEINLGPLKTGNKLFANATGTYLTIQDSDDWSHIERFERILNVFMNDPQMYLITTSTNRIDTEGNVYKTLIHNFSYDEIRKLLPDNLPFIWPSIVFKKELFDLYGGFNEYFDRISEGDYHYFGKLISKYKTVSLPDILYYYRNNPKSFSKTKDNIKKYYSASIAKFLVRQQLENGTDALETGKLSELRVSELLGSMKAYYWTDSYWRGFVAFINLTISDPLNFPGYFNIAKMYILKYVKNLLEKTGKAKT